MRKDDIIGQKLFETCKLSEFYLNLVVNCKDEDNESPFQLARAYKQKLYEIVERYDRLLDANKQRQQLSLTFDNKQQKTSTRTSTPNKTPLATPNSANNNNNTNTSIFNYHHTPSAPCTPSTPITPLFSRSSQSILQRASSTFNQTGRGFIYTQNSTKYQNRTKQQQQQQQNQQSYSTLNRANKLLLQNAYLYEDDDDSADEDEISNYYLKNKYTPKKQASSTTILPSSSSGLQSAMLNCKLNYETYSSTFSKLNQTNPNDETVEGEYNEDDDENDNGEEEEENLNDEDGDDEEEEYTNDLNESQIIEKSYSNLSKDSGVFADSYHSDYSTGLIGIGNHDQTVSSNLTKKNGDKKNKSNTNSTNNNSNIKRKKKKKTIQFNDTNSTMSTTESNKTIDSTSEDYLEQIENKTINQQDEQQQQQKNDQQQQIGNETVASNQLIWGSITQLVEGSNFNKDTKSLISSSPIESPKSLVKSNTVINNFEFNTNEDLVSIMNTDDNQAYSLAHNPSSSNNHATSTSKTNKTTFINRNHHHHLNINSQENNDRQGITTTTINKELKFLNTNSLMNVSMLDNIQATNTHLDFDNMNTSILMFN